MITIPNYTKLNNYDATFYLTDSFIFYCDSNSV